ncbi:MAG: hypothetical protein RLZZ408_1448 [Verrucomicrobiota bacterium]|jgi:hypothetical protein
MTKDTIRTSITAWAGSRGIQIVANERSLPPAELDMRPLLNPDEVSSAGAGLHVFIDAEAHGGPDAHIGFWIPDSLKKGSWSSMAEDDDEIPLHWIPEFSSEQRLIAFIDRETAGFFLKHIQEATLDEWLADNGYSYTALHEREYCGEAAELADSLGLQEWLIVEFKNADGFDITLGVSGWGDAATFYANEDGFLTFDQRGKGLRTRDALVAWLESVIKG